jgi:hypothetical protein
MQDLPFKSANRNKDRIHSGVLSAMVSGATVNYYHHFRTNLDAHSNLTSINLLKTSCYYTYHLS